MISIRSELPEDLETIHDIVRSAFATHPHSLHNEHRIVDGLRAANALAVSLVAVSDSRLVGYIACSPVSIGGRSCGWFGLGPVAVSPDVQNNGIGAALMRTSIEQLRRATAAGIVLLGEPDYYGRFGFVARPELILSGAPARYFLSLPLGGCVPHGAVTYHSSFEVA